MAPGDEQGAGRWAARLAALLRAAGLVEGGVIEPAAALATAPASRVFRALGAVRSSLHDHPSLGELATQAGLSERHARRAFDEMDQALGTTARGWRETLGDLRLSMAQQLLSLPDLPLEVVARHAGFRSPVALCHAFAERGALTPRGLARAMSDRWSLPLERGREAAE